MNDDLFKKTEGKLYDYFQAEKKISCLNLKIELLKKHVTEIETRMKETDISIPEESRSSTYEESVQTSRSVTSYAEKAAIRIIEDMESEIAFKKEEIALLEKIIRTTEADNAIIEYNLNFLTKEDRQFLKLRYEEEKTYMQIGMEMNIAQSTATRVRRRLVEDVAKWDKLINVKKTDLLR